MAALAPRRALQWMQACKFNKASKFKKASDLFKSDSNSRLSMSMFECSRVDQTRRHHSALQCAHKHETEKYDCHCKDLCLLAFWLQDVVPHICRNWHFSRN